MIGFKLSSLGYTNSFFRFHIRRLSHKSSSEKPLSLAKLENLLYARAAEIDFAPYRASGHVSDRCPIKKVYVNQLASTNPIEDRWNIGLNQVGGSVSSCLFTVLDGHSGSACVHTLAWAVLDYVAVRLLNDEKLKEAVEHIRIQDINQPYHFARRLDLYSSKERRRLQHAAAPPSNPLCHYVRRCIRTYAEELLSQKDRSLDPSDCLTDALLRIDEDLCIRPFDDMILNHSDSSSKAISSDSPEFMFYRDLFRVAMSGSSGIVGRIYWHNECSTSVSPIQLHLANVGDCGAVLLRETQTSNAGDASILTPIKCTTEHSGTSNPKEIARILQEHPENSVSELFRDGGRLLGELAPLRAFGDARYKWPVEKLLKLSRIFEHVSPINSSKWFPLPHPYTSPPYLTAKPEITSFEITPQDRYLVLATDGLWDKLNPQTVAQLLSPTNKSKSCPATQLLWSCLTHIPPAMARAILPGPNYQGSAVEDLFQSQHRTREERKAILRSIKLLSLPPGLARYNRDDITIVVLELFNR